MHVWIFFFELLIAKQEGRQEETGRKAEEDANEIAELTLIEVSCEGLPLVLDDLLDALELKDRVS